MHARDGALRVAATVVDRLRDLEHLLPGVSCTAESEAGFREHVGHSKPSKAHHDLTRDNGALMNTLDVKMGTQCCPY